MANTKISALTAATTPLAGTEVLPIVQSGTTKQVSVANLTAGRAVSAGSLALTATGSRLTGDMSTATQADRLLAQTSTANNSTTWGVIPNGTSQVSQLTAHNSSDPANASRTIVGVNSTYSYLTSNITGTGTYLPLYISVNNAVQCQFETSGDVKLNTGNLVQGTAAKGMNFTANTAAAGMTSQLLNWYEQGTFTPTAQGSSSAGTASYTIQTGQYTRIGNRVIFNLRIAYSGGTGTGNMRVGGLPFTSNSNLNGAACSIYAENLAGTASYVFVALVAANATYIAIDQVPVGGGGAAAVAYDGAADISLSGSYIV